MRISDIKIGAIYHNGKGLCRKVTGFYDALGRELIEPERAYIEYSNVDVNGNEKSGTKTCWCTTFADWAKGELNPLNPIGKRKIYYEQQTNDMVPD